MARIDTTCLVCGIAFHYYPPHNRKCCSKRCQSTYFSGEGNPFYGRSHTDETKQRVSVSRKGKCVGNQNAKGYRHLDSAKKKIAEASKRLWRENREKMIASLPRGIKHHFTKDPSIRRYRQNFTPLQRREWTGTECTYCGATEALELDHIIPVFDGGTRRKSNTQTLCRGCNLWKLFHVDLPRYNANLGR